MGFNLANNVQLAQPRMAGNLVNDGMISLAGKEYPLERAKRVYEKLTNTKGAFVKDNYHEGPNLKGTVTSRHIEGIPTGYVGFTRRDPNTGDWSYDAPEGEAQVPVRELIDMKRNFDQYKRTNPAIYTNEPISDHRAKAYRKQGFVDVAVDNGGGYPLQVIDARRFQNSPAVQELLSAMDRTTMQTAFPERDITPYVSALEQSRQATTSPMPTAQDMAQINQVQIQNQFGMTPIETVQMLGDRTENRYNNFYEAYTEGGMSPEGARILAANRAIRG